MLEKEIANDIGATNRKIAQGDDELVGLYSEYNTTQKELDHFSNWFPR